jgi:uncharacterized protein (DUF2141 family)
VFVFAQPNNTKSVTLEIHNVTVNGGKLYISVCASETAFRNDRPDPSFEFFPADTVIRQEINVPAGECVILIFQDTNNNRQSDTGFLGIPKELVGISNWNGKGSPENFRKHKININDTTSVVIHLYQL